jgi:hypothetical protein
LDLADKALWQTVKQVTQPAFYAFGASMGDSIFQEITEGTRAASSLFHKGGMQKELWSFILLFPTHRG